MESAHQRIHGAEGQGVVQTQCKERSKNALWGSEGCHNVLVPKVTLLTIRSGVMICVDSIMSWAKCVFYPLSSFVAYLLGLLEFDMCLSERLPSCWRFPGLDSTIICGNTSCPFPESSPY